MAKGREIEIKFAVPREVAEQLVAHPLLRPALAERRLARTIATYFDTPDARLRKKRVSLRVRRSGSRARQTLKHASGALIDRAEWESEVEGATPDLDWLRSTPLKAMFKGRHSLDPHFTVEVTRTTFPLAYAGATIEGALDQGSIRADGETLAVDEFELELKSGSPASVLALGRELARDLPLTLSLASKAERGFAVADRTWGQPTKTIDVDLAAAGTLEEAFAAIVQACLRTLCNNAGLIGDGHADDGREAVHKTRIALRHLRATLDLFEPVLRRRRLHALMPELRWIMAHLGTARDVDVFGAHVAEWAGAAAVPEEATALAGVLAEHARDARDALGQALGSPRWRLLLLDLLALSMDGVRRRRRRASYKSFVRGRLERGRRVVVRRSRRMFDRSAEARHAVRKRAKMLRYDLDLFAGVRGLGRGKRARHVGEALQTLQDTLGVLHDGDALREHLAETVLDGAPGATSPDTWRKAQAAARELAEHPEGDARSRRLAIKAAHRLRGTVPLA